MARWSALSQNAKVPNAPTMSAMTPTPGVNQRDRRGGARLVHATAWSRPPKMRAGGKAAHRLRQGLPAFFARSRPARASAGSPPRARATNTPVMMIDASNIRAPFGQGSYGGSRGFRRGLRRRQADLRRQFPIRGNRRRPCRVFRRRRQLYTLRWRPYALSNHLIKLSWAVI
jgi:hypothetical protein